MAQPKPKTPVLPSLETFLFSEKLLSPHRSVELLRYMAAEDLTAGSAVMRLQWVSPKGLGERLKAVFSIPTVGAADLDGAKMKQVLSEDKIRAWQAIPFRFAEESGGRKLVLGLTDPLHRAILQSAETLIKMPVQPAFLSWNEFKEICGLWFGASEN